MEPLRWKNPGRKRNLNIKYTDPSYVIGYDLDNEDFQNIIIKLKNKEALTYQENTRYGNHILTIIEVVLENNKFKDKPSEEKFEIRDQMSYELCTGITTFNPDKGSSIFSYAYRIAYVAGIHYYTKKAKDLAKQEAIIAHCLEELDEYIDSITDHKKKNINKEMK